MWDISKKHWYAPRAWDLVSVKKFAVFLTKKFELQGPYLRNPESFSNICWGLFDFLRFLCFLSPFSLGPTGIKGATVQMLPWEAPTDLKTLPMGILHDYMSCWTTLGPFGYPRGPNMAQTAPKWPKMARNHQNGSKWHCMTPKWP